MPSAVVSPADSCEKENLGDVDRINKDIGNPLKKILLENNKSEDKAAEADGDNVSPVAGTSKVEAQSSNSTPAESSVAKPRRTRQSGVHAGRRSLQDGGGQSIVSMFAKQQAKVPKSMAEETRGEKSDSQGDEEEPQKTVQDGYVDDGELPAEKRMKTEGSEKKSKLTKTQTKKAIQALPRCQICRQRLAENEIKLYPGHPNGATEEFVSLTDPRLSLFTGDESAIYESDERPQNKLTHFR